MSANDNVREYLDYYFSSDLDVDFAVMINGPWGAGKTYFAKQYFKQLEMKRKSEDALTPELLYASLYGVKSTSEITDQFFAQAHPILNSKAVRLFGTVATAAINRLAGATALSTDENKEAVQKSILDFSNRILIFDDLERSAMSVVEVMGFINTFVEHEGLKVIVIANEDEISEKDEENYKLYKEKLIGKTLKVTSDPRSVIVDYIKNIENKNAIDAISNNIAKIIRVFDCSGKVNFRSLRSIFMDFDRLISSVDQRLGNSSESLDKLVLFMTALGLEFRSGSLSKKQIIDLWPNLPGSLAETYKEVDWWDSAVPPAAIAELFATGIIEVEAINTHIAQHPLIVGYSAAPEWRQLWDWPALNMEQYAKATHGLREKLNRKDITDPGIILHAASIILDAEKYDFKVLEVDDTEKYFSKYVEEIFSNNKLEGNWGFLTSDMDTYLGYGYTAKDDAVFKRIRKKVKKYTREAFKKKMEKIASQYINRIKSNPNEYPSLYEHGFNEGKYGDVPFLHFIPAKDFAEVVVVNSVPDRKLFASLIERYKQDKQKYALSDEHSWLKELRVQLELIAKSTKPPHKHLIEGWTRNNFEQIEKLIHAETP